MRPDSKRVAVVVAGAGARGGYEAGALSVLIPTLEAAGVKISMYVGTSAGAINATIFAGLAHLPPADQAQQALDVWRTISVSNVFRSPTVTSPDVAARFVGQMLRVPGVKLVSLLDTEPLRREAGLAINWEQLSANITDKSLTLAVVATSGGDNRTVVFVQRGNGEWLPPSDDERPIDYVSAQIRPAHVLASSAIPIGFPPVRIENPPQAAGWYVDGGVRLNAPLKPAISLGADALVVVATHPEKDDKQATPRPNPPPPDVDDMVVRLIDVVLVDRMVEDLRTLSKINALTALVSGSGPGSPGGALTPGGRPRKVIPYIFVGPDTRERLGLLANEILNKRHRPSGGVAQMLRDFELRVLGHALEGEGPRRGDLFSYLYFDQEFIEESIKLGQDDANAYFDALSSDKAMWRTH
jgi:NTE family protein